MVPPISFHLYLTIRYHLAMRISLLAALLFMLSLSISASTWTDSLKSKLLTIDLSKLESHDLCTDKKILLQNLHHVKVWSMNCANCLWEFEDLDKKLKKDYVLINVDTNPKDIKEACLWLKKNKISLVSINDKGSLQKLLGETYPLPMSLSVQNNIVKDVIFGYWRKK